MDWLLKNHRVLGLDWNYLVVFGFLGQGIFTMRFAIQWIASERQRKSVIPLTFWYLSILGSKMLAIYFVFRRDPVGLAGNLFGSIVYARNLQLIRNRVHELNQPSST